MPIARDKRGAGFMRGNNDYGDKRGLGCFLYASGGWRAGNKLVVRVYYDDASRLEWRGEQNCELQRARERAELCKIWYTGKGSRLLKIV